MDADGLLWWSTQAATCGLVVEDAVVVDCPPYARKLGFLGRDARELWREQARRSVDLQWVPDVAETQIPDHTFFRLLGKNIVACWRTGVGGGWSERHVRIGWLPDGRWWVERTDLRHAWLYRGADQRKVRAAAEAKAVELRVDEVVWQPSPVVHQGRRIAVDEVRQWPPGLEPDPAGQVESQTADQR